MTRSDTGETLRDKIMKEADCDPGNKIHMLRASKYGSTPGGKLKLDETYRDFQDVSKLIAYEYPTFSDEERKEYQVVSLKIAARVKTYSYVQTKEITPEKWMFTNMSKSCRDLKLQVFRYFFPLLELPIELNEKIVDKTFEEQVETAYKFLFEDSDEGEALFYRLRYMKKDKKQYYSYSKEEEAEIKEDEMSIEELAGQSGTKELTLKITFVEKAQIELAAIGHIKDSYGADSQVVSLDDCMAKFSAEELLQDENQVYCRRCKEHRDVYKKMDIYTLPHILIFQLKRFNKDGGRSRYGYGGMMGMSMSSSKNSDTVDFPLDGLDMSKYVLDPHTGESSIYDLYAISNHSGSLYGGHYIAHCKNSLNGKWYCFNDSSVSEAGGRDLIDPTAYVLFYRRRNLSVEQKGVDIEALD